MRSFVPRSGSDNFELSSAPTAQRRAVAVLPDVAGLDRAFTYLVPDHLADEVTLGSRVRISLHGRRVAGWIVQDPAEEPPDVELHPILRSSGMGPPPELVDLARWAAWRWAGPPSALLGTASPPRVVRKLPRPPDDREKDAPDNSSSGPTAARSERAAIIECVRFTAARPGVPVLARLPPVIDIVSLARYLLAATVGGVSEIAPDDAEATPGGSTRGYGSAGGTQTDRSMLVLVPGLEMAERMARALERLGVPVARAGREWDKAAAGWTVVVGARAAAWSPPGRLSAALVIDAHDEAYREERAPTWTAWEVVAERCARDSAPCLLTTPVPTVALVEQCLEWEPTTASRYGGWPRLQIEDRRDADPRTGLLSDGLVRRARQILDTEARHILGPEIRSSDGAPRPPQPGWIDPAQWRPIVCVLNRRGRARLLACSACGELTRCDRCGGPMEELADAPVEHALACRRCGAARPVVCAYCGSTRLKNLRPGLSKIREDLEALLQQAVVEVSGPLTEPTERAPILVGTEAVLHRVRRASLVAFLDFDQHLLAPTYTAGEAALALLARAARMVSIGARSEGASAAIPRLLVQTRLPRHDVITAVQRGDLGPWLQEERQLRRSLGLPPSVAWAVVSGPAAEELVDRLDPDEDRLQPAGDRLRPERDRSRPGANPQRADGTLELNRLDENKWLISAATHSELCDTMAALGRPRGRVRVEVDPLRL